LGSLDQYIQAVNRFPLLAPEQEIEFDKGTSTKKLTIDQPGIVDVEDHALGQVIVQLEVS